MKHRAATPRVVLAMVAALAASPGAHAALGLIGFGIPMYQPVCATACRDSIAGAPLACTAPAHPHGGHAHGAPSSTTPECRAGDGPYLTTLAWCMRSACAARRGAAAAGGNAVAAAWRLERYWAEKATGNPGVAPKWTFQEALAEAGREQPPSRVFDGEAGAVLDYTALVDYGVWAAQRDTLAAFEGAETLHSLYGIILLVVGVSTPIVLTLMGHLPFMTRLASLLKPYLVYPSLIGAYHVQPLPYLLGNAPTIGQTLYIVAFLLLNVALTAAGYTVTPGSTWYATPRQEVLAQLSARTGVLALALAPLVVLLAGRNSILLRLTDWPRSTYMVLHRWVARVFALQVLLHSVLELLLYTDTGELEVAQAEAYWVWGAVATAATSVMVIAGALFFRRLSYEVFLALHVLMAVLVVVGSWYHVELLFARRWGYELWLYVACGVWSFDRLVRLLRVCKNGVRYAEVVEVTDDVVRVDVPGIRWSGVRPGMHAYVFFPSLHPLRPWENHPFSVIPTAMLRPREYGMASFAPSSAEVPIVEEKFSSSHPEIVRMASARAAMRRYSASSLTSFSEDHSRHRGAPDITAGDTSGISLYVKKSGGMTKHLCAHDGLLTLLDGPYPNNHAAAVLRCDRLVLVAGGIGITGVLAFATCHTNAKLYWSLRQEAAGLARDLETALSLFAEKEVRIGARVQVARLLDEEAEAGWATVGVIVCGPGGLCDDVRAMVAARGAGRGAGGTVWELEVDAFSW